MNPHWINRMFIMFILHVWSLCIYAKSYPLVTWHWMWTTPVLRAQASTKYIKRCSNTADKTAITATALHPKRAGEDPRTNWTRSFWRSPCFVILSVFSGFGSNRKFVSKKISAWFCQLSAYISLGEIAFPMSWLSQHVPNQLLNDPSKGK